MNTLNMTINTHESSQRRPYLSLARALVADAMLNHDTRWLESYVGTLCLDMLSYTPTVKRQIKTAAASNQKHSLVRKFMWKGEILSLEKIAQMEGVSYTLLRERVNNGYDIETAIKTPRKEHSTAKCYTWNGQNKTLPQIAAESGMSYSVLYMRLSKGWSIEAAVKTPVRPISREK